MQPAEELFGDDTKIALMRRSAALWSLLRDNPSFAYYGRAVGLSAPGPNAADTLMALARLQGASVAYYYPKPDVPALFQRLKAAGFDTARHEHYYGQEAAYEAAQNVLRQYTLPSDLSVVQLDQKSDPSLIRSVAEFCQSCEVMPIPGTAMRGADAPGVYLVALDEAGAPVANAASYRLHHPNSPHANDVFWGMLATRPDRRGQKISLILGAMAIVHMWETEGARAFMTGVKQDNLPSRKLCAKLGVFDSDWTYAQCIDAALLGGTSITK